MYVSMLRLEKNHHCDYCVNIIESGSSDIFNESGISEDGWFSRYACKQCEPYIHEFWGRCENECDNIPSMFKEFMSEYHPDVIERNGGMR